MLHFRYAGPEDVMTYYNWANDPVVRQNSYQQSSISYENHVSWFNRKIKSDSSKLYLFLNEKEEPVGQVRIENENEKEATIGISIDQNSRGKGFGAEMLVQSCRDFHLNNHRNIKAYIKKENTASYEIFKKAGFIETSIEMVEGSESYIMVKKH